MVMGTLRMDGIEIVREKGKQRENVTQRTCDGNEKGGDENQQCQEADQMLA